jgi:hypothetical protein
VFSGGEERTKVRQRRVVGSRHTAINTTTSLLSPEEAGARSLPRRQDGCIGGNAGIPENPRY